MAAQTYKPTAPQKGDKTSGRTMSKLLARGKTGASESRPLRVKNQLQPKGNARFPEGKFRIADPTGTKTWDELEAEAEAKKKAKK